MDYQPMSICPDCEGPLERVKRPAGSYLNEDQFDSVRAGDLFCRGCFTYWWADGRRSRETSRLAERLRAEAGGPAGAGE